jgi:hypothetical protein
VIAIQDWRDCGLYPRGIAAFEAGSLVWPFRVMAVGGGCYRLEDGNNILLAMGRDEAELRIFGVLIVLLAP